MKLDIEKEYHSTKVLINFNDFNTSKSKEIVAMVVAQKVINQILLKNSGHLAWEVN